MQIRHKSTILENKNFLNNQNYIISEENKKEIIKANIINKKLNSEIFSIIFNIFIIINFFMIFLFSTVFHKFISYTLIMGVLLLIIIIGGMMHILGNMITKKFIKFYYTFIFPTILILSIFYKSSYYIKLIAILFLGLWPIIFYIIFLFIDFIIKLFGNIFDINSYNIYVKNPFYKNKDSNSFLDINGENYFIIKK